VLLFASVCREEVEKGFVWLMTLHFMFVYAAKTFLDL
jgi:hypothetical protein